jgi:hypothetical protein
VVAEGWTRRVERKSNCHEYNKQNIKRKVRFNEDDDQVSGKILLKYFDQGLL